MLVDGTFEKVVVTNSTETEWSLEDVDFKQDGFSFICFIDTDSYPLFDNGYTIRGYIDGGVVARGDIVKMSPVTHEGETMIRVFVNPPNHSTEITQME